MIGGGATGVEEADDPLVWLCHPGDGPEPVVAVAVDVPVVAVVTVWFVVGVTTVWAFGGAGAVTGPVVVADPVVVGAVDVVSFVAVVFPPGGKTVTGCLEGDGTTEQERIRDLTPRAVLRSSAAGGRQPGIAPRTARPRTRRI